MRTTAFLSLACILFFTAGVVSGESKELPHLNEWTQDSGSADHNNFRPIEDVIKKPVILWHAPDSYGVPAVIAGKVYLTGEKLQIADLRTGRVTKSVAAAAKSAEGPAKDESRPWEEVLPGQGRNDDESERYQQPPPAYRGVPVVAKDLVIVTKNFHILTAFSLDLEGPRWELDLSKVGGWRGGYNSPAYEDGVLVASGGYAVGVEAQTGKVLWTVTPEKNEGAVSTPPTVYGGKAFFFTERGGLIGVDLKTGKVAIRKLYDAWFGWTSSAIVDGKIFIGDRGGRRGRDREERGERRGGAVNAFDIATGERVWMTSFGATGCSGPGVGPNSVFTGHGASVAFYDMKTGKKDGEKVFWSSSNPFGSPTLVGKSLIFGNLDGNLYVFDFDSKKLKWRFTPEPDSRKERFQVHDFAYLQCGIILVATTNGVYAIGSDPSGEECPPRYVLRAGEQIHRSRGIVVGTVDYANGLSVFHVKAGEETVKLETNIETLKHWLRWSYKTRKPVEVVFKRARIGMRLRAWILSSSPTGR